MDLLHTLKGGGGPQRVKGIKEQELRKKKTLKWVERHSFSLPPFPLWSFHSNLMHCYPLSHIKWVAVPYQPRKSADRLLNYLSNTLYTHPQSSCHSRWGKWTLWKSTIFSNLCSTWSLSWNIPKWRDSLLNERTYQGLLNLWIKDISYMEDH